MTHRSLDNDLADHAVVGVRLAVRADDAAAQVGDAARRDRHEPPFSGMSWKDLNLTDCALNLGERRGLAIAHLRYLDLARVDELAEAM